MSNFTKIAIQQSFMRLLSQRPITKITVKDIVEDCGINRNSFYYHFQDLPQLLETVIIESADEIISRIPESFSLEEGLTTVLERLVENKRAIRNIWASPDRAFYEQNLMRVCNYVVSRYIACRSADLLRTLPEEELALLVDFCQCELFGQVTNWLNQNNDKDIISLSKFQILQTKCIAALADKYQDFYFELLPDIQLDSMDEEKIKAQTEENT